MNIQSYFTIQELDDLKLLTDEAKRLFIREKIKSNFEILIDILGYKDLGIFHKPEIEKLNKIRKIQETRNLWLWARGHFKTSIITISHGIFLIINNPDIRILLVSNTLEVSKKIFSEIRNHFIQNEDFRYFFHEFCPVPNKDGKVEWGTTEAFTIPNRNKPYPSPSIMCAGIGTNLTGLHFDYMKIDDIVTRDSITNDTQMQASKDYYASLRQLYDNPEKPAEDICGTTYHFNDLYAEMRKSDNFTKSIIPAKIKDEVVFKEKFSEEGLKEIQSDPTVGPLEFSSQYMLNPINPSDVKFKEEWLKQYSELPPLAEYITVDPASTQKKKSDYTVIERWGVDWEGKHYLLDGFRDKLTAFQRIDKLFEIARKAKNLKWVKYEVLGGRHGDLEVIKEKQQKEQFFFWVKETKSQTASKTDRIEQRLVGAYYAGIVLLPQQLPFRSLYDGKVYDFVALLKNEYLQFPFSEHDDILDCQSQMFEEESMRGVKPAVIKDKPKGMTADDWDRMYDEIDHEQHLKPWLTRAEAQQERRLRFIRRAINTGAIR